MTDRPTFSEEIGNLLHAAHGNPLRTCIQCGTCAGTCPVVNYMDHTPRRLIGMINANLKAEVLASSTFWLCASCYHCTVRCPSEIDIAGVMYAVKRYSMWHDTHREGLIGPVFSEIFVRTIAASGRSYEPILAPAYIFTYSPREFIQEVITATEMMLKGRLPVLPSRIKRLQNFRRMLQRIIPLGGGR